MKLSASNKLSKIFTPALLLTAALGLPATTYAANDGGFATDGYVSNDRNSDCMVLRQHDGSVRYITGDIGDLQSGDHVRLYGYSVSGSACDVRGNAYEVTQVQSLWGDDRHKTTYYDHLRDGSFSSYSNRQSGRGGGRYDDRDGRYDNRGGRYNGRDGRYRDSRNDSRSDRDLVSLRGRLNDDRRSCPTLETQDGRVWNLIGDLRSFRDNSRAKVVGWTGARSQCGGPTLDVREISRY